MHIELKEEDPVLVYRMIRYCYMLTWLDNHVPASLGVGHDTWISTLDTIVKMYAIGDEYDIQGLKQAAVERFGRCLQDSRASSSENLEFLLAVHLIYTTTPDNDRGLRDPAAKYGSNIWEWLWHLPDFRDYLSTYEDFVYDIVTRRGSSDASSE